MPQAHGLVVDLSGLEAIGRDVRAGLFRSFTRSTQALVDLLPQALLCVSPSHVGFSRTLRDAALGVNLAAEEVVVDFLQRLEPHLRIRVLTRDTHQLTDVARQ